MTDDSFHLDRFVVAQGPSYERAIAELRAGAKRSHWMWFVFPQLAGLGSSTTAQLYAIASLAEAGAYLAHPILGPRLREATAAVLAIQGRSLETIFGSPDHLKFRSCMTLFEHVGGASDRFGEALVRFCGGLPDKATLRRLA